MSLAVPAFEHACLDREGQPLALRATAVRKGYGERAGPRRRLAVGRAGEAVAIIGENGAGKSTLLRHLRRADPSRQRAR